MKLSEMKNVPGSTKDRKRKGRGAGSGNGKTAGKGHKGQKARSGGKVRAGFEGGQMPLARRLPKYGFTNIFRTEYAIVNLDTLEGLEIGDEISAEKLVERGVIKKSVKLKVLGRGDITKALTVTAAKFTKSAVEKIEKAGGKVVVA